MSTKYFLHQNLSDAIENLPDAGVAYRENDGRYITSARFGRFLLKTEAGRMTPNHEAIRTFFGRQVENDGSPGTALIIGHSGQIQALISLLALAPRSWLKKTPRGLAEQILMHSGGYVTTNNRDDRMRVAKTLLGALLNDSQSDNLAKGDAKDEAVRSRFLFDASGGSDHLDFRMHVRDYVLDALVDGKVLKDLDTQDYKGRIDQVFTEDHYHARDCAKSLTDALVLQTHLRKDCTSKPVLHWFEPSIENYIRTRSEQSDAQLDAEDEVVDADINDTVVAMLNALTSDSSTKHGNRFVILRGPEESGKKAIVGDFLHLLVPDGLETTATLRNVRASPNKTFELPIMAISLRTRNYRSLVLHVLAFLQQRSEHSESGIVTHADNEQPRLSFDARVRSLERDHPEHLGLPPLLDKIRELHRSLHSLFVFIDVEDLAHGSMARMLHHRGLFRLLTALHESNGQSRFVVTATEMEDPQWEPLSKPIYLDVKMPKLDRFRWYLTNGPGSANMFKPGRDPDLILLQEHRVPGDILALWALLFEAGMPLSQLKTRIVSWLEPYHDLKGAVDKPRSDALFTGISDAVYGQFVAFLEEKDCLIEAALIAAVEYTEDGIREKTLEHLAERLREKFGKNKKHNVATLQELSKLAQSMVLRHIDNVPFDEEERGVLEPVEPAANVTSGWSMSRTVALGLQRVMLQDREQADLIRSAHRAISRAARRLSQTKRMRKVQFHRDAKWSEIARDVQCFMSLLASIPPEISGVLDQQTYDDNVRLKVDEVFSLGASFDPRRALRFAYFCLLREDLDEQFQLSMRLDLDELRLRLYLSLLHPPGLLHTWTTTDLRDKNRFVSKVQPPPPYPGALTDQRVSIDIAELLLTVSLAAYHCQTPWVISWTCSHFPSIGDLQAAVAEAPHRSTGEANELYSRFLANAIDASLLIGEPIDEIPRSQDGKAKRSSLTPDLIGVHKCISEHLHSATIQRLGEESASSLDKLASLRLRAREAELAWFIDEDPGVGRQLYKAVVEDEFKCGRSYNAQGSVVTSGRSGRRYLRVLSNHFPVYRSPPTIDGVAPVHGLSTDDIVHTIKEFEYVIETNLGRLNVYGGADRIGVLLDQARKHCLELKDAGPDESLGHALADLVEVERHLASAPISAGSLFEVKTISAAVVLLHCELDEKPCAKELNKANEQIESAQRISARLGLSLGEITCHFLKARLFVARARLASQANEKKVCITQAKAELNDGLQKSKKRKFNFAVRILDAWIDYIGQGISVL